MQLVLQHRLVLAVALGCRARPARSVVVAIDRSSSAISAVQRLERGARGRSARRRGRESRAASSGCRGCPRRVPPMTRRPPRHSSPAVVTTATGACSDSWRAAATSSATHTSPSAQRISAWCGPMMRTTASIACAPSDGRARLAGDEHVAARRQEAAAAGAALAHERQPAIGVGRRLDQHALQQVAERRFDGALAAGLDLEVVGDRSVVRDAGLRASRAPGAPLRRRRRALASSSCSDRRRASEDADRRSPGCARRARATRARPARCRAPTSAPCRAATVSASAACAAASASWACARSARQPLDLDAQIPRFDVEASELAADALRGLPRRARSCAAASSSTAG